MEDTLDPLDKALVELWNANHSGAEVAILLGLSRHAVLGRIYRLRMSGYQPLRSATRAPQQTKKPVSDRKKMSMPSVPVTRPTKNGAKETPYLRREQVVVDSLNITIEALTRESCRFINGNGRGVENVQYCGLPKAGKSSYCKAHNGICYVPPKERNRRLQEMS